MEYLTLKNYKRTIIRASIGAVLMVLTFVYFVCAVGFNDYVMKEEKILIGSVILFGVLLCSIVAGYPIYKYISLSKVCNYYSQQDGYVESYSSYKGYASLAVSVKGEIFYTKRVFPRGEAKDLVGRTVTCAYIDNELFIYNIKG